MSFSFSFSFLFDKCFESISILLNHELLAVLDIDTLLGVVHTSTAQVVNLSIVLLCLNEVNCCCVSVLNAVDDQLGRVDVAGQQKVGAEALDVDGGLHRLSNVQKIT